MLKIFLIIGTTLLPPTNAEESALYQWQVFSAYRSEAECKSILERVDPPKGVSNLQCVQASTGIDPFKK